MFNPGDLVTGKDRSYRRSIYKVIRVIDNHYFALKCVCFNGHFFGEDEEVQDRAMNGFRLARQGELMFEFNEMEYRKVFKLLSKLNVTQFFQEQQ